MMSAVEPENRLFREKSPYLLQHADNPVHWLPWGEEAFKKARTEGKPIFLSIGYSTCHWCHVMAHESFEDPEVAELLNRDFLSIKVDREERPDIDHIYMNVCQTMTGSGGWPLTIIMTPDGEPFFAGTYIPKSGRFGMTGLLDLLPRITDIWKNSRARVNHTAREIVHHLNQNGIRRKSGPVGKSLEDSEEMVPAGMSEAILHRTYESLHASFDEVHGGFGKTPKFPSPHTLLFLMRYWKKTGESRALEMVERTLQGMRAGGMYDHLGFGFHRYSTDAAWRVPHFEKMLYDQALLSMAYTNAYQITRKGEYKETVKEIFAYVFRVMTSLHGAFYSAEDADSQGEEGTFYLWTTDEIRKELDPKEAELVFELFSIRENGNFHDPHAPETNAGKNILHLPTHITRLLRETDVDVAATELRKSIGSLREKLFNIREGREHPFRDDKILTDWNGLMIASLARAARILGEPEYEKAAVRAVEFIWEYFWDDDNLPGEGGEGELLHRFRDGEAAIQGNLDDYSFLIWGFIELYLTTFESHYLERALQLNTILMERFWDGEEGGFFFTSDRGERLIARRKEFYDGAVPSGNSVAVMNLIMLGRILGNPELEEQANKIIRSISGEIDRYPTGYAHMISGIESALGIPIEAVITGKSMEEDSWNMIRALWDRYLPNTLAILNSVDEASKDIRAIAEYLEEYSMVDGKATAYVCKGYSCMKPTTEKSEMIHLVNQDVDHDQDHNQDPNYDQG